MTINDWIKTGGLVWFPSKGFGYLHPQHNFEYGEEYYEKYQRYQRTPLSDRLMDARAKFVDEHWGGELVDVGAGTTAFIDARANIPNNTTGFDVNPYTIKLLKEKGVWFDPYNDGADAITMWDSMEHMEDPAALLWKIRKWVFISMPIYRNAEAVLSSKHYRPDEHIWYFTVWGLEYYMKTCGFEMVEFSMIEDDCGREGIGSFAFKRMNKSLPVTNEGCGVV